MKRNDKSFYLQIGAMVFCALAIAVVLFLNFYVHIGQKISENAELSERVLADLYDGIWIEAVKMLAIYFLAICLILFCFYYLMKRKHGQLWHYYRHTKNVMQNLPELLIEYNLATHSIECFGNHSRYYKMLTKKKVNVRSLLERIYEQDREIFLKDCRQILTQSLEERETELRICNEDGVYEWVSLSWSLVRDRRKNPTRLLITVHSIEHCKETELALLQHQNRLAHTIRLLGNSYYEILYIDLQKDSCEILKNPEEETVMMMQYQKYYTYWTEVFAETCVYEEDRVEFVRKMSAYHIRKEFAVNQKYEPFCYRRKSDMSYKWVQVDCVLAPEYGLNGEMVILYMKNLDNQNLTF